MYTLVKGYRDDPALRASFNALAEATFGLNFEGWYQNGFWSDNYNPHSMVADGEVVANVSVNRTDFVIGGKRRKIFQLGTVMTAPEHRNKGLIRAIMAEIDKETADADGVYLFGNDSAVAFYPKFGFVPGKEYVCTRSVTQDSPRILENIPMDSPAGWNRLAAAMAESTFPGGCRMIENPELLFFYVSQFMQDTVYRHASTDTWIIAEPDAEELLIHNVFTKADISLDEIIAAFGREINHVTLGFSPTAPTGWEVREFHEEDCTFFVKGKIFEEFETQKLRVPTLSHA